MSTCKTSCGVSTDQQEYSNKLVRNMEEFRNQKQLCDVIISTLEKDFPAHKLVLAACSSFFRSLFTLDMTEKHQQKVELNNINAEVMGRVLQYMYTGTLTSVSPSEARELFEAADYLILPELKGMATGILQKSLSAENCLRILGWSHRFSNRTLFTHAFRYILDNFTRVSRTADFLILPAQELRLLLSSTNLRVIEEEEVYEALTRWTEHKPKERRRFFVEYFDLIRLEHISSFYLKHVVYQDIMSLGEYELLAEISETLGTSGDSQCYVINPLEPPRRQVAMMITVLAPDVYSYIPTTRQWLEMASVPTPRIFSSSVMCCGLIYCVGGLANSNSSNIVECFDPTANVWLSKASLPVPTRAAGVAVLDEFLYVVGGRSNGVRFNIVQRYDPRKDCWTFVTSLREARSGTALVSCRGKLYAIGGRKDESTFLRSVECYCPTKNTWSLTTPMNVERASSAAACIRDKIYVIGGVRSPEVSHNSCEVYDIVLEQWNMIADTVIPRSYAGIASFKECLLVCGGEDSDNFHDTVEYYDIELDSWQVVDKMPKEEKFVDCCTMFMSKDLLPVFPCLKCD